MRVLIPVDIADFLRGARHFTVSAQIVEKHKSAVEVNPLQNIVCHHNFQ